MGPDVIPWAGDLDAAGRIRWGRWQSSSRLVQTAEKKKGTEMNISGPLVPNMTSAV